jgi:Protein of unknown function (DUF3891)
MIVRQDSDGSLVMITQNDHAKAAGFCAKHWGNARFAKPRPYESTIRAAFLHDLPWLREEACPLFDPQTCRTPNYLTVANESQLAEYKWANDWVYRVDKYAGLLVSKHRTGIWNARYGLMRLPQYKLRNLHPSIQEHIAISHEEQDAVAADFDARELTTNYILLQVWDLFSLYICSNESLKEESYDPVPTGYAEGAVVVMRLKPISGRRISVDPYPFDQPSLDINVVYRRLPTAMFQNAQAFLESYFATPLQVATFTFIDSATGSH